MKRVIVYGLLTLILGAMLAVWAAGTWLLESPDGIRWLLREVSRRTPVKIDARVVTGGIGKTLRMEGVTVRWPHGEAAVQELRLRCRPLWLPFGRLAVQELSLRGVSIQDNEPDSGKPPDLAWPLLTGTPEWLDAWIDHLQVDGLRYRRLETPPVTMTSISAALNWRHAVLTATNLDIITPEGRATGAVTAGFEHPTLTAALAVTPARPVSDYSRFDLRARLLPGRAPEQLAGKVSLTALRGSRKSLELAGDVGMTRNSFNLRGLELTRTGATGHDPGGRDRPPYRHRAPVPPGPPGGRPRPLGGNRHGHRPLGRPLRGGDRRPLHRTVRPGQQGGDVADGTTQRDLLGG